MKKIPFKIIFYFIICLLITKGYSQSNIQGKGKAIIFFEPKKKAIVRLDTTLLIQKKEPLYLTPGKYIIRAWAPTKELFIDTIDVIENKLTFVTKGLKDSQGYKAYKNKAAIYRSKIIGMRILPLTVTLGYATHSLLKYNNNKKLMSKHLELALQAKADYESAISASNIDKYKKKFNEEEEIYERYRAENNQLVKKTSIIISGAIAVSTALIFLSKKIKKPVYSETPLLSLNQIIITNENSTLCSIGLLFNINK